MENPYYIPGTNVLKNKLGITDAKELEKAEKLLTTNRIAELRETPIQGYLDYQHLKDIHKHIFQDIYDWAGKERIFQSSKNGHNFEFPQKIKLSATLLLNKLKGEDYLKNLEKPEFIKKAAHYYAELNVTHPFPEGNGRSQKELFTAIAENAGYEFQWNRVSKEEILEAAKHSYSHDNSKLEACFTKIVVPINQLRAVNDQQQDQSNKPDNNAIAQAREMLMVATETWLSTLTAPLEKEKKRLESKVTELKRQVAEYKNIKEPFTGKARHREAGSLLQARLTEAKHDVHVFKKKYKTEIPKMRKKAAEIAEKKHPEALAAIAKSEASVSQKLQQGRTKDTPTRRR